MTRNTSLIISLMLIFFNNTLAASPVTVATIEGEKLLDMSDISIYLDGIDPEKKDMIYKKPGNIKEVVDELVRQELIYLKSNEEGFLEKNTDIKMSLDRITKGFIAQSYVKKNIEKYLHVSDSEALSYYKSNKEEFKVPASVVVDRINISINNTGIEKAENILSDFKNNISIEENTKDSNAIVIKKNIRYFKEMLPSSFVNLIFSLDVGKDTGILRRDDTLSVFIIKKKIPDSYADFEKVKPKIIERVKIDRTNKYFYKIERNLLNEYKVKVLSYPNLKEIK